MIRLMTHNMLKVLVLFMISLSCGFSQQANQAQNGKTIVWSKIENGFRIQLIQEKDHEYILKTPLEIVEQEQEITSPTDGLFDNSHVSGPYRIPEIQTEELIRQRFNQLDVGLPVVYSSSVKREVDRLLVDRRTIELALGRAHYFLPHSREIIEELQLPAALQYLPLVESSFRPRSYSHVGARGIWQFMSATARLYGLEVNARVDHRLDPKKSTRAAMILLKDLYEEFGDWNLALAAYNAGPGRVSRAVRMSGLENPGFWDVDQYLPRETRRYIPKFLAAVYVMEHVDQIGLMPDIKGYNYVKKQIDGFQSHPSAVNVAKQQNRSSTIPQNSTILTYTVKSGDNIGFIADWYDVQANELRRWNNISGNLIRAGQELKVYVPENKSHIYSDINKLTFAQKQHDKEKSTSDNEGELTALEQTGRNYIIYKVKSGDTLWDISRKNGISINEIKQLNNISNTRNLKPGMVIKIREKS